MILSFYSKTCMEKEIGGYTVVHSVGEGRYGKCYFASSPSGSPVIIKRFKSKMLKKNKEKNVHEAVILSQLKHERIPELLGVINNKGFYAFVLEFKPGKTIEEMLFKQNYIFNASEIYNIGFQLIEVIKYLHYNGVVHRDIRCANVLYDGNNISLVDFGLARWIDGKQYKCDTDFSYLGDLLLYLIYSTFEKPKKNKKHPWYEELSITCNQKLFLKRLLRLEPPYSDIIEVECDYMKYFNPEETTI